MSACEITALFLKMYPCYPGPYIMYLIQTTSAGQCPVLVRWAPLDSTIATASMRGASTVAVGVSVDANACVIVFVVVVFVFVVVVIVFRDFVDAATYPVSVPNAVAVVSVVDAVAVVLAATAVVELVVILKVTILTCEAV